MKKLILLLALFISSPVWAASTYYVRNDAGDTTNCSGTVDASLSGAPGVAANGTNLVVDGTNNLKVTSATHNFIAADVGGVIRITAGTGWTTGYYTIASVSSNAATLTSSPAAVGTTGGTWKERLACGWNHPAWALGASNNGTAVMVGGDTLIVDDVDEVVGSGQAQYMIGAGMPNGAGPDCNRNAFPYSCTLGGLPAGPDASHTTKMYGKQYASCAVSGPARKPQLWGTQGIFSVLGVSSNTEVKCMELTDHSACMFRGPHGANVDGDPLLCPESYPTTVAYARNGINTSATIDNFLLQDAYVHGVAYNTIVFGSSFTSGTVSNMVLTRVDADGGPLSGVGTDAAAIGNASGPTLTYNQTNQEWAGCGEHYPLVSPIIDSPLNFHHCYAQQQGGYGDGTYFGNATSGPPGFFYFHGPGKIAHNTSDCLDTLHGDGSGGTEIDRYTFEGCAGQQLKITGTRKYVENSFLMGNCMFFTGQPFTSTTSVDFNSTNCVNNGGTWDSVNGWCNLPFRAGDSCRANGSEINVLLGAGVQAYFYNNTIVGGGSNIMFELNGSTCDGTTKLQLRNNVMYGGWNWLSDTGVNPGGDNGLTTLLFNNGSGSCSSFSMDEDYDIVANNFKNGNFGCSGSHSQCGVNPQLIGNMAVGHGTQSAYFLYPDFAPQSYLLGTSPAINAGIAGLTFQNGSNDYNNQTQTSPPTLGAVIRNSPSSCTFNTNMCTVSPQCCSLNCASSTCSELNTCSLNGQACDASSPNCCNGTCTNNICTGSCTPNGGSCSTGGTCCSTICLGGQCSSGVSGSVNGFASGTGSFKGIGKGY